MNNINPFLATDGYKVGHHKMYPQGTTLVYSNFTPRSNRYAPKGCDKVVSFGQQMVMKQIHEMFANDFFKQDLVTRLQQKRGYGELDAKDFVRNQVCREIKEEYSQYLGADYDVSHIEALWDLGYLPIEVKALPEGTLVPMGVPVLTIHNTNPYFFWLTNFLETLISNLLWKPMTSATIANQYRANLTKWALATDSENVGFVDFQGHDFSMRGMDSIDATISSGLGHATSFLGSDSLPVIHGARKYYNEKGFVVGSVNATEHSVMCAGTKGDEIGTFRYLMSQFPTGILSIVSDTWDLWKVLTEYLPQLKEEILARDGKIVIRPDSGDPVDIICGLNAWYDDGLSFKERNENAPLTWQLQHSSKGNKPTPENYKGVVELLWEIFGGTINSQGYKVLDPHIGAIYGDSITIERAEEICKRLEAKGFASTNIVLGVGSFTYQYNTRDTFGFAMKATYVEVTPDGDVNKSEGRGIFKDPITDDGTKKSARGLLRVEKEGDTIDEANYILRDSVSWNEEAQGFLQAIYKNGNFNNEVTLTEIRNKLKNQ